MDVVITGRHCSVSDDLRGQVAQKLEAALHVFPGAVRTVRVIITAEKLLHTVEVVVELTTNKTVTASAQDKDPLVALNLVEDKLSAQMRRLKEKIESHHPKHREPPVRPEPRKEPEE